MTSSGTLAANRRSTSPTVVTCYDLLSIALPAGYTDYTDGKYDNDRNRKFDYFQAQERQANYLLDQVSSGAGSRLLDVGCGFGRILQEAERRGAEAVGITISPPQAEYCRKLGLTVDLLDYRDIGEEWNGSFDGIVANGSLEHFAQVTDAVAGRVDDIYREMFHIFRRLLRPGGRLVTTAIHFKQADQVRPEFIAQGPYAHPRGSPDYHFAMILERTFGGWLPCPGQLEKCARNAFRLVDEEDGTHDYHLTSEFWLLAMKRGLALNPRVWLDLSGKLLRKRRATLDMLRCLVIDQSWMWQFREPAPTRLYRHTWEAV